MSGKRERVQVLLTESYLNALDLLVERGVYGERQVAIRDALRILFRSHNIPPFQWEAEAG